MSVVANLYYFPPISYIYDIIHQKELILEVQENYQKRSNRNRCSILGSNGIERLHIPLKKGKNQQQNIRDVQISYDEDWMKVHWRAICTNYGGAPYYIHYKDQLKELYTTKDIYLLDFNLKILKWVINQLNTDIAISYSTVFLRHYPEDTIDRRDNFNAQLIDFPNVPYMQIFSHKIEFIPNLSILDLLMCQGPYAQLYLKNIKK